MASCIGCRKLEYLVFLMGLACVVGDCPLGYCTLPSSNTTSKCCNIEVDTICSSETYCHGNGQCFKDRGSAKVFCNCSEETDGDSCQLPYNNTLTCSAHIDCNNGDCNAYTRRCHCYPGYRGNKCEIVTRNLAANYPFISNMCENGGTLYIQAAKPLCMCPCGFSGQFCSEIIQEPANPFPSQDTVNTATTGDEDPPKAQTQSPKLCNNGTLLSLDQHNRPTCHCACGYFGQFCEYSATPTARNYKNWCDDAFDYCLNGAICLMKHGKCNPICYCKDGYFGYRCNQTMDSTTRPSNKYTVNDKGDQQQMMKTVIIIVSILLVVGLFGCIFFCICILDDNCKHYLCCYIKKSNDTERSNRGRRRGHAIQNGRNSNYSRHTRHTTNTQCDNMTSSPTSNLVIGNRRPFQSVIALPTGLTQINPEENLENHQSVYTEPFVDPDSSIVDIVNTPPPYGDGFNVKLPTYEEATNHM